MDDSLSVIPFLEVVASVFLMCWVDSWSKDHFWDKFSLGEALVHKQVVFLMHGTMTTLA